MNTKHLKAKILDLAIRGKLVPQDPSEGNAAEFSKKSNNISENEIPFQIPENWSWCRLDQIANIERGGSPRPIADYLTTNDDGINWIKIGDTKKGDKYIVSVKEKIKPEGIRYSRFVHAGDFLLTNSMSFGRPYILKVDGCIHDGWLVFGNIDSCISPEFLFQLLSSPFIYQSFKLTAVGSTVKNLNIDRVKQVIFPLPPLSEQQRIVSAIEKAFEQIDIIEKNKLNLKTYIKQTKSKVLDLAIHGKLVEQNPQGDNAFELLEKIRTEKAELIKQKKLKEDKKSSFIIKAPDGKHYEHFADGTLKDIEDEIPFEIPENWCWCRLPELCSKISDGTHKTPTYVDSGIPFLSVQNISKGYFDLSVIKYITLEEHNKLCQRIKPIKDDILICRIGTLGRAIRNTLDFEFSIFVSLGIIRLLSPDLVDYVITALNSNYGTNWIDDNKVQGSHTNKINLETFPKFFIPLPPLPEQKRIVDKIEQVFEQLEILEKSLGD